MNEPTYGTMQNFERDMTIEEIVKRWPDQVARDLKELARVRVVNAELLGALKLAKTLLDLGHITVGMVFDAGIETVNAVGLNPWCMREGLAAGDEPISLWEIEHAIENATPRPCQTCNGSGRELWPVKEWDDITAEYNACPRVNLPTRPCSACKGIGKA